MIKLDKTLIINGDISCNEDINFKGMYTITCGLSNRSTVTASSIDKNSFTYCLQRNIFTIDGKEIIPQEFNVYFRNEPEEIYPYLEMVTLLIVCGISIDIFKDIVF